MDTDLLLRIFREQKKFKELISSAKGNNTIELKGLSGSSKSVAAASYIQQSSEIHVFIMNDSEEAAYFYNDLFHLLQPDIAKKDEQSTLIADRVLFFPSSFKRSSKYGREDSSNIVQRTHVLEKIRSKSTDDFLVLVSYPEAVAEMLPATESVDRNMLTLKIGDRIGIDFIREVLLEHGFERSDFVYEPGQFAIRGGIVDIFSYSTNKPYRIEFFGDDIENIRNFDINTQLSIEQLAKANIMSNLKVLEAKEVNRQSLFQYISPSSVVWCANLKSACAIIDDLRESPRTFTEFDLPDLIESNLLLQQIFGFCNIHFSPAPAKQLTSIDFDTTPQPAFNKKFDLLAQNLLSYYDESYMIVIMAESSKQVERLRSIFSSKSSRNVAFDSISTSLHEGFVDRGAKIVCYTDHQIFQRYHAFRLRGAVDKSNAITLQELTSLNVGDYIVHTDHGIGVFGGLVKIDVNGKLQEMVRLTYKDNDSIFVNLQGLHRISKYRGKEGTPPKVYKLGTGVWNKLKQAAKAKIKDMAEELISLYAKRKHAEGFRFSPDSYLQHELEASFIYEDTPDQNKTTADVKADMEKAYPMDRLVCGDVGFGKTEIAIRAAFKAATDGKQVAILVPTTILALQHYKSFKKRLSDFPVKVDFISRMKSTKEIKASLSEVEKGGTDILIGTHRILSKDVKFKDLGLLVIDEEQRFGVGAKEKIRQMKVDVDTLTLTATPIPRTLQFSLLGARDLSVINTPPPNRQPVTTEVHTFSEIIIKDAIDFEVSRGGQVFFIHNKIQDIHHIEEMVRRLCPQVKTITAHGKMDGEELENIMTDFVDTQYDVLISTTIIESGLDIPNANTIIIHMAQNFGLSELHQLRGRVGRSNRKAYCYLLAPSSEVLTPDAKRRLKAIEEFSDLGSGFNISMQDLDIRGAGNLLGGEQSGFIAEIGFETYQRILAEAMLELKDEKRKIHGADSDFNDEALPDSMKSDAYINDCYIDVDFDISFPDEYISNRAEKLRLYRELDDMESDDELFDLKKRLVDRFGTLPSEAEELFDSIRLRHLAIKLGFEKIKIKNGVLLLYFISDQQSSYFNSIIFGNITKYLQTRSHFRLREKDNRLYIATSNIKTVKQAAKILQDMDTSCF